MHLMADMDDTLYPLSCGINLACRKNIQGFVFDNDEFHAYVHGRLPYETLKPDALLRNMLLSMPQRKIVSKSTYEEQRSNSCY
ncbi:hypothetical protein BHE74_00008482 [Ensete ventricosum]|nr:hypothetical protein GW17_00037816 [Ensete ventricosum]RWW83035.1 hypothetical protein BHE74_00008482 [Ensete ventricosum]RZR77263.1 hypothetical protein BHM03_00002276 [Ensete ventricosum]